MEKLIAILLFLFSAQAAAQGDAMAQIRSRLEAHPVIRSEFVQTRTMADLQRPLVSRGRLVVWQNGGVIWYMDQPFRTTYVLRDGSTIEIAGDGSRTVRSANDDRGAARIGRILRAVLKGDARTLDEWFTAQPRIAGERWTLDLVPRQGPMAFFVKSVHLAGGDFVDSVRIVEESGDTTQMQFRNPRSANALSDEEQRLLTGD